MKKAVFISMLLALILSACANDKEPRKIVLLPQPALGPGIVLLKDLDAGEGLSWAPDGRTLAGYETEMPMPDFCLGCNLHSEIFVVDTTTWTRKTILWTDSPTVSSLSWFPDSRHLAYDANAMGRDESNTIRSIQIDGQNDVLLHDYVSPPTWSHEGSKVAFQTFTQVTGGWYPRIDVLDIQSSHTSTVFTGEKAISYVSPPTWSPDDQRLAFSYGNLDPQELPRPTIYEVEIETGKVTRLLNDDQEYLFAAYAPKGNLMAVIRNTVSIHDVAALRDLASACEVTLPIDGAWRVSWSPDGHKLVISAARSAYIVDLDKFLGPKFAATGSICP